MDERIQIIVGMKRFFDSLITELKSDLPKFILKNLNCCRKKSLNLLIEICIWRFFKTLTRVCPWIEESLIQIMIFLSRKFTREASIRLFFSLLYPLDPNYSSHNFVTMKFGCRYSVGRLKKERTKKKKPLTQLSYLKPVFHYVLTLGGLLSVAGIRYLHKRPRYFDGALKPIWSWHKDNRENFQSWREIIIH